jgi:hypothetical protein
MSTTCNSEQALIYFWYSTDLIAFSTSSTSDEQASGDEDPGSGASVLVIPLSKIAY